MRKLKDMRKHLTIIMVNAATKVLVPAVHFYLCSVGSFKLTIVGGPPHHVAHM